MFVFILQLRDVVGKKSTRFYSPVFFCFFFFLFFVALCWRAGHTHVRVSFVSSKLYRALKKGEEEEAEKESVFFHRFSADTLMCIECLDVRELTRFKQRAKPITESR